jgi:hypothetical protein
MWTPGIFVALDHGFTFSKEIGSGDMFAVACSMKSTYGVSFAATERFTMKTCEPSARVSSPHVAQWLMRPVAPSIKHR